MSEISEIDQLVNENDLLHAEMSKIHLKLKENEQKIKRLLHDEPTCSSCGKHRQVKNLVVCSQKDVADYVWKNEGDEKPVIGEYICKDGCY